MVKNANWRKEQEIKVGRKSTVNRMLWANVLYRTETGGGGGKHDHDAARPNGGQLAHQVADGQHREQILGTEQPGPSERCLVTNRYVAFSSTSRNWRRS